MHLPALPAPLERAFRRVQDVTGRAIAFFQPIVVSVLLVFVYLVGVGLTWLVCAVFYRRMLQLDGGFEASGSYWRDAEGYGPDQERLHKQI